VVAAGEGEMTCVAALQRKIERTELRARVLAAAEARC